MKKALILGLILALVVCAVGCDADNSVGSVGEVVEINDFKISYEGYEEWKDYAEFFAPDDGYKVIRAYFEIENIGKADKYIGRTSFECYADGYIVERFLQGEQELEGFTSLSAGRKMEGYVYYTVPKDVENVEIEYCSSSNDKAIFKVIE